MRSVGRYSRAIVKIFILAIIGALFVLGRYILKNPQLLKSLLPGEGHLYKNVIEEPVATSHVIAEEPVAPEEPAKIEEPVMVTEPAVVEEVVVTEELPADQPIIVLDEASIVTDTAAADETLAGEQPAIDHMQPQQSAVVVNDEATSVLPDAYCVKCRTKRGMQNAKRIVIKNGRNAMEGTCPVCGTRLFRFISTK